MIGRSKLDMFQDLKECVNKKAWWVEREIIIRGRQGVPYQGSGLINSNVCHELYFKTFPKCYVKNLKQ